MITTVEGFKHFHKHTPNSKERANIHQGYCKWTFLFFFFFNFIYLFLAVLGLRCCTRAFSSCSERGLLFVVVHGLLIAVTSLVAEHGL